MLNRLVMTTKLLLLLLIGAVIGSASGSVSGQVVTKIAWLFSGTLGLTFYYGIGYAAGQAEAKGKKPDTSQGKIAEEPI